jgi:hypothetical protein
MAVWHGNDGVRSGVLAGCDGTVAEKSPGNARQAGCNARKRA